MSSKNDKNHSGEKDRSKIIFNEVLQEFQARHMEFYKLKDQTKLLFKTISNILMKISGDKCKNEFKSTQKFYELINDDIHGFYFEKKPEIENNEKDALKIMNEFERCIDKHTGINKKINLFEISSQNLIYKNKNCIQNCEKQANDLSDIILKECFFGCVNELLDDMSNLQIEYNQDLQNIINKF